MLSLNDFQAFIIKNEFSKNVTGGVGPVTGAGHSLDSKVRGSECVNGVIRYFTVYRYTHWDSDDGNIPIDPWECTDIVYD